MTVDRASHPLEVRRQLSAHQLDLVASSVGLDDLESIRLDAVCRIYRLKTNVLLRTGHEMTLVVFAVERGNHPAVFPRVIRSTEVCVRHMSELHLVSVDVLEIVDCLTCGQAGQSPARSDSWACLCSLHGRRVDVV